MIGMVEWRYGVVGMVDGRVWFALVCNSLVEVWYDWYGRVMV